MPTAAVTATAGVTAAAAMRAAQRRPLDNTIAAITASAQQGE
jgi:hypothetical protein